MAKVLLNTVGAHISHWSGALADRPSTAEYGSKYFDEASGIPYIYGASGWVVDGSSVIATIAAGEAHIGETSKWSDLITITPTVAATAHAVDDVVGGKLTITNAVRVATGKGKITSLKVVDAAKQNADLLVFIFGTDLAGTYADDAAEAVSAIDWLKWIGTIEIQSSDWKEMTHASLVDLAFDMPVEAAAGRNLYALIVTPSGATFTADCLQLIFGVGE